jgi:class 3 adenylate cyclase
VTDHTLGAEVPPAESGRRETRKTVTVLFADVAGSTTLGEALDPESLRGLMTRYFAEIRAIIERHGGTIEKFIGDAVMAVFGVPIVHEDDALRAVRAAAEIRDRLADLNAELTERRGIAIRFRTGVNTGDVIAAAPTTAETFVTGDSVNTAARLEQNAPPGEVLLGASTYGLVRDAVEVEPVEPIAAKGKAEPVAAYRLIAVKPGAAGHERHLERRLVGRERELDTLRREFELTIAERSARLVTILGPAGVGKSRLVVELMSTVEGQARVLECRCLPYGEGIAYWPVRQLVGLAADIGEADTGDEARAKLRSLLHGEPEADLITRRVGAAIGLETEPAPQEELFWAIRKLLELVARQSPAVVLVEDIHWAEPTLLDLLEYIVALAADAPLLIVCPARPELLEHHPGWTAARSRMSVVRLAPLPADQTETLIEGLPGGSALPPTLRSRILAAAEGNPLFAEELLAMLVEDGQLTEEPDGTWQAAGDLADVPIPLSIRALLAARIDGLPDPERRVAVRASVVGRVFEAAAVRELSGGDAGADEVGRSLLALVRKELVRPDRSELTAGDAFAFRHILIRDAAYEALPKAERAVLHEHFAEWLTRVAGDRAAEYEEITAYHYAEAHRYRIELGEAGESVHGLAQRAAETLGRAAGRAWGRRDIPSARRLVEQGLELVAPGSQARAPLLLTHLRVLWASGKGDAVPAAEAAFREEVRLRPDPHFDRLIRLWAPRGRGVQGREVLDRVYREALDAGDEDVASRVSTEIALDSANRGRFGEAGTQLEEAMRRARASGDPHREREFRKWLVMFAPIGPTPVREARPIVEAVIGDPDAGKEETAYARVSLARLDAMEGRLTEAREHLAIARGIGEELGLVVPLIAFDWAMAYGWIETLFGDAIEAEPELGRSCQRLEDAGEGSETTFGSLAPMWASALVAAGDHSRAAEVIERARAAAEEHDPDAQSGWRSSLALLRSAQGRHAEALSLAAEAVRVAKRSDMLALVAEQSIIEARVAIRAGDVVRTRAAVNRAVAVANQKGASGLVALAESLRPVSEPRRRPAPSS